MVAELEAERLLDDARNASTTIDASRLVFAAFLALSRTADPPELTPLVARMAALRDGGTPEVELLFLTLDGVLGVRQGRFDEGRAACEAALRVLDEHRLYGDPLYVECGILATLTLIRPHETRTRFAQHINRLDIDVARRARLLAMVGVSDAWAGHLVRGQAEMLEARELAVQAGSIDVQAEVSAWLVHCEALRGDLASAGRHLAEARLLAARTGSSWVAGHVLEGAVALHFAAGDTIAWVGMLELLVAAGIGGDSGLAFDYRWELATHRMRAGDHAGARALVTTPLQPPLVWPGGAAMAAWRDWILAPDDPAVLAAFEAALPLLTQPTERLPRARMAWLIADAQERAGNRAAAIRLLEAACHGYASIGAAGMLAQCAAGLRRLATAAPATADTAGWRAPQAVLAPMPGEAPLTGAELRVVVAVADGLSNREAALRLHVSVKTIEYHLGNIFRKLGVRNRTELARRHGQLG